MSPDDRRAEAAFWRALRDGDDTGKLALADWYQERGNPVMAHALKWCVRRGHWPRVTPNRGQAIWQRWRARDRKRPPHQLTAPLFLSLGGPLDANEMRYRDLTLAVAALAFALDQLAILCRVPGEGGAP